MTNRALFDKEILAAIDIGLDLPYEQIGAYLGRFFGERPHLWGKLDTDLQDALTGLMDRGSRFISSEQPGMTPAMRYRQEFGYSPAPVYPTTVPSVGMGIRGLL